MTACARSDSELIDFAPFLKSRKGDEISLILCKYILKNNNVNANDCIYSIGTYIYYSVTPYWGFSVIIFFLYIYIYNNNLYLLYLLFICIYAICSRASRVAIVALTYNYKIICMIIFIIYIVYMLDIFRIIGIRKRTASG